ncbi:MAG: hypothetical protein ACI88G_001926 [Woeseiaceae bacterium]|jgi:hypothetical protein
MKTVHQQVLTLLAMIFALNAEAAADNRLQLDADTPKVNIETHSAEGNFLRLPGIRFAFRIDAACAETLQPVSLLLSVADTRKSLRADEISGNATTELALNIPASQIAPVAIQGFCEESGAEENPSGRPQQDPEEKTITAALSVQASLRCASETDEQTLYTSMPLDVILVCNQAPQSIESR